MKKQILFMSTVLLQTANCLLPTISCAQKISGGSDHSLAVCNDSTARAWGHNNVGELGNGTNTDSNVPVEISSLTGLIAITGSYHSLALKNDGTLWAWGDNFDGELGNGTNANSNVPLQVSSLGGIIMASAGENFSLALKSDGTLWSWGRNDYGQLGCGTNSVWDSLFPVHVDSLTSIYAIAAGEFHSFALKNDGTVWAWGQNLFGQLGIGTNTYCSNIPVLVNSLTGISAIAGGYRHSLALRSDGTVWSWGDNTYGQLGNGTNTDTNVALQVSSLTGVIAIATGSWHSFAVKSDGTVWAWGRNNYGQLGNGTNTDSSVPVEVSSLTNVTSIEGGLSHSLALKNDGTLWAWGDNTTGQLGNGTNTGSNIPVQVTGLCQVTNSCNSSFILLADTLIPHHYWGLNFSMGVQPLTYLWSWGDGTYDSIAYPSHTYAAAGFYTICLTIHDTTGCTDSTCIDYNIQKLSAENTIVKVDVVDSIPSVPTNIRNTNVLQSWSVFPNPTSGNSFVNYTLSTPATVSIALYDVLGNKLQQLVNGNQQQGEHNSTIDAHELANGVYVLQIRAGDQMEEQKIAVMN